MKSNTTYTLKQHPHMVLRVPYRFLEKLDEVLCDYEELVDPDKRLEGSMADVKLCYDLQELRSQVVVEYETT